MEYLTQIYLSISSHGAYVYALVFGVSVFEATPFIGTFTPGVLLLIFFGLMASEGHVSVTVTILMSVLGAFLGDCIGYYAGKYGSSFLKKHPNLLRIEHINAGREFFDSHGGKSLIIGRFVGLVRPVLPLLAGIIKVPPLQFFIYNSIGVIIWSTLYILLGFFFGAERGFIHHMLRIIGISGVVLIAIAIFAFYFFRKVNQIEKVPADIEAIAKEEEKEKSE